MFTWLIRKMVKKNKGFIIANIFYKPQQDAPNVVTYSLYPELRKDKKLNDLYQQVADRTREFYQENPKLLEEILKCVKEK